MGEIALAVASILAGGALLVALAGLFAAAVKATVEAIVLPWRRL